MTCIMLAIGVIEVEIMDMIERDVYKSTLLGTIGSSGNGGTRIIDLSGLGTGVYFYQLTNDKETVRGKFVIER